MRLRRSPDPWRHHPLERVWCSIRSGLLLRWSELHISRLRRSGPTDTGVTGCQGLESAPQSQRRSNTYITNTAERAMVVHSSASATNGIAPNNIVLVALRK